MARLFPGAQATCNWLPDTTAPRGPTGSHSRGREEAVWDTIFRVRGAPPWRCDRAPSARLPALAVVRERPGEHGLGGAPAGRRQLVALADLPDEPAVELPEVVREPRGAVAAGGRLELRERRRVVGAQQVDEHRQPHVAGERLERVLRGRERAVLAGLRDPRLPVDLGAGGRVEAVARPDAGEIRLVHHPGRGASGG